MLEYLFCYRHLFFGWLFGAAASGAAFWIIPGAALRERRDRCSPPVSMRDYFGPWLFCTVFWPFMWAVCVIHTLTHGGE